MPNHPAVTGALVVAGLAFATAVAIYESPQARQFAEDFRRKVAIALYALGNEINPVSDEKKPRFNRPEDAEGLFKSEDLMIMDGEVDENARRRQREELLYWNTVKLAREEKEHQLVEENSIDICHHGPGIYDFRHENNSVNDQVTYVYNTGADPAQGTEQNLRSRGKRRSISDADPFSDKYHLETNSDFTKDASFIIPKHDSSQDMMSDIYNATDTGEHSAVEPNPQDKFLELAPSNVPTHQDFYTSIHTWAEAAHISFSPNSSARSISSLLRPTSPRDNTNTGFELSSTVHDTDSDTTHDGKLTPTDSGSLDGSVEDRLCEEKSGFQPDTEVADLISSNGGSSISGTWSEVDSVISEND